ncbi:hypothetical protein SprV_0602210100 [Sparganum proliferum]
MSPAAICAKRTTTETAPNGSLGIIPADFPGSSATVSCRAYFLIDGVKISVGEATASIQLSDMLDADLNYKNAEGISPGETVTCKEPANIFLPGDAEWNGFRLQDYDTILMDDDIVLPPVPLLPLLMAWILWFCILFFNALFVAYLLKQNSLYRITQMQVMNRKRTGGTRLNRVNEYTPHVALNEDI